MGEGMPHYRNPFEKGNLYIKFDITFPPNNFTEEMKLKVGDCSVKFPAILQLFHRVPTGRTMTENFFQGEEKVKEFNFGQGNFKKLTELGNLVLCCNFVWLV